MAVASVRANIDVDVWEFGNSVFATHMSPCHQPNEPTPRCCNLSADTNVHTAMTTLDQISQLIHASFPVDPLPNPFFGMDGGGQSIGDIPDELLNRIAQRPWVEITMRDWTMTGAYPCGSRRYLDPNAFRYYLPSLLVGGLQEAGYIDWALESILPAGRKRRPTGKWWKEFAEGFSEKQRVAICTYLTGIRLLLWDSIGSANQQMICDAEAIWLSSAKAEW
jgi:hypothetical protein